MRSERSLATVLFTDIVGSTERAAKLRDAGWSELRREHDRRIRRELGRFGGEEISTAGDSFLATFDSPARGIACADAIRSRIRELGLEIRAGLHMGEIELTGEDVGGLGVNIGARVAAEAGPGEILVSRSVHDGLAGSQFDFEDRGVRALKGVPGEWRLFAVTGVPEGADLPPGHWPRSIFRRPALLAGTVVCALLLGAAVLYLSRRDAAVVLTPEEILAADAAPGIAVLPFTVNDSALETWREGMVDLLSINLDGVPGLRPIASRTVMARWREEVEGIPDLAATLQVARRTGARYALVGNAVAIGPEVRFAAEIYDARTGEHLGSAGSQGSPDSVFALVDRLSIEVVRALPQGEEGVFPKLDLASVTTTSLPALKSYLEGEHAFRRSEFEASVSAYRRAVEADSTFALALVRLESVNGWGQDAQFRTSKRLTSLLDRLPERLGLIARANPLLEADSVQTRRRGIDLLREATRKYPDDADVWYYMGEAYTHNWPEVPGIGENDAVGAFSRVIALDETYSPAYWHMISEAFAYADSASADRLIRAHRSFAPEERTFDLPFALAFGPPSGDTGIRTALLDTTGTDDLRLTRHFLLHPRFQDAERQLLQVLYEREPGRETREWIVVHHVVHGRMREALAMLDDWKRSGEQFTDLELLILSSHHAWRLPLPRDLLDRELALGAPDTSETWSYTGVGRNFHAGAYAAERGRWRDHATALSRLADWERRVRTSDDPRNHRRRLHTRVMVQALGGLGLWRRDRREDALRELEESRGLVRWGKLSFTSGMISVWLGQLLLEMGRPADAVPYFRDWWTVGYPDFAPTGAPWPLASYYLGKTYEAMGDHDNAREAYLYFAESWREADPEFQPMVQEARQAAMRLERE